MNSEVDKSAGGTDRLGLIVRLFGWGSLFCLAIFLANNALILSVDNWPVQGSVSIAVYVLAFLAAFFYAQRTAHRTLRVDAATISDINAYLIRACFWAVLFIGVADMIISFIRVEGWLEPLFGDDMAS